ncbi:MAG: Coenzyme F420 hydrogenase/dehydrogenase, beta subunit C-terminal domain, partial [Pyramidobacter sp.]|nr:Coenzyme F420 hydrogenase/dehydrogenase, beta subunit C-terminal domain [Pyramidobacter sp.]
PWELFGLKIRFSNGSCYQESLKEDAYMRAFLSNLILRPSCTQCRFRQIQRPVDLTLADFWGVKNVVPDAYDKNGTSLVLLHTQRARELFAALSGLKMSASLDAVLKSNSAITHDVRPSPYREEFFARLNSDDVPIDELLDSFTYRDNSAFRRFKRRLARALGRTKQIRRA